MIKNRTTLSIMITTICLLSAICCIVGLLFQNNGESFEFISITNETVLIYGNGLYKNDSLSVVAQGKASDLVTLFLGIPLLAISAYIGLKGSFRGQILLTGTLSYFLYTFMSYTFLWHYNPLFILYVLLMSLSLFSLIICFTSFNLNELRHMFSDRLPIKKIGGFQIFVGFAIGLLWLGKIFESYTSGEPPKGLEHYTTLVIQAMDLGILVPVAFISGIELIRKKPIGYLLTSVVLVKSITMLTSITAMIISMLFSGLEVSIVELTLFPIINLLCIMSLASLMKNIQS